MQISNLIAYVCFLFAGLANAQLVGDTTTNQDKMKSPTAITTAEANAKAPGTAKPSDSKEKSAVTKSKSPAKPPFTGRLPRYFSKVVSPTQRETIYEIQHSFRAKIDKLQQELDALKQEQAEAVNSVLSEIQIQQVEQLRNKAAQR